MDSQPSRRILLVGVLRVALVLIGLAVFGFFMDIVLALPAWLPPGWRIGGFLPLVVGLALEASGTYAFWRYGSGTPHPAGHPRRLVTQGPYAWSRNPLYLARLLILLALAWILGSLGILAIAVALFVVLEGVLVPREEHRLEARLGSPYVRYRTEVSRWWTFRRRDRQPAPQENQGTGRS